MKYFSIDLETSRIDPKRPDGILMASLVFEDSKTASSIAVEDLPHLTCLIDHGEELAGPVSYIAMAMNSWLLVAIDYARKKAHSAGLKPDEYVRRNKATGIPLEILMRGAEAGEKYPLMNIREFTEKTLDFLDKHAGARRNVTFAGKNAARFDLQFLPDEIVSRARYRVLDAGSVFVDWELDDDGLPSLELVKNRAGLVSSSVSHDALEDARDVIRALRVTYGNRSILHRTVASQAE